MDAVLVHVGTNNLARCFDAQAVLAEMGGLIRLIKRVNSEAHIVISGIIPRLKDLAVSDRAVKDYNKMLGRVCRDCNVMMIRCFNGFTCGKQPNGVKEWLFCKDGLHLSARGDFILGQIFRVQFSDLNVLKRRVVMDREAACRQSRDESFGYKKVTL